MKTFIIAIIFCFGAHLSYSQETIYMDSILISDYQGKYLECYLRYSYSESYYWVVVMDPNKRFYSNPRIYLRSSKNGDRFTFKTRVQALNFLYKNGWEISTVEYDEDGKITNYLIENRNI